MLTYFLLKPESLHMIRHVKNIVVDAFRAYDSDDTKTVEEAFDVVINGKNKNLKTKGIVHLETRIADKKLVDAAYPDLEADAKEVATRTLFDKPVTLLVMNLEGLTSEELIKIKGKIAAANNPDGTGLRGSIKKAHKDIGLGGGGNKELVGYLEKGQNFIHIPDNDREVAIMIGYCSKTFKNEGSVTFTSSLEKA